MWLDDKIGGTEVNRDGDKWNFQKLLGNAAKHKRVLLTAIG